MKHFYILFFCTLRTIISKNGVKTNSENNAYYLMSLLEGINLLSIFNVLKSLSESINNFELSFFFCAFIFFVPPFLFNHLFFIRKNRYEILINEIIDEPISPSWFLIAVGTYLIFTIFFFGFSLWVNT
jgi:drug/metabolite transporter (DMT)-like permease